jgi:alpha-L-fucosidase
VRVPEYEDHGQRDQEQSHHRRERRDERQEQKLNAQWELQTNIITNDRLKRPNFTGDYKTPEQRIPKESDIDGKDWETCMTMNNTWGYKKDDHEWKSAEVMIRNLVDIASKGGNYLLNVGPKDDGTIPDESIARLKQVGAWMKVNGEAIYGTKASPLAPLSWGRCTKKEQNGNTILYLSVFNWPADKKLVVPGVTQPVTSATLLATGKKLATASTKGALTITLPEQAPDKMASVIKLQVKGKVADKRFTGTGTSGL